MMGELITASASGDLIQFPSLDLSLLQLDALPACELLHWAVRTSCTKPEGDHDMLNKQDSMTPRTVLHAMLGPLSTDSDIGSHR